MSKSNNLYAYLATHPLSPENTRSTEGFGQGGRPKYRGQFSGQANTHRNIDDVINDIQTGHSILRTVASNPSVSSHGDAEFIGYTMNKHKYIAREEANRKGN